MITFLIKDRRDVSKGSPSPLSLLTMLSNTQLWPTLILSSAQRWGCFTSSQVQPSSLKWMTHGVSSTSLWATIWKGSHGYILFPGRLKILFIIVKIHWVLTVLNTLNLVTHLPFKDDPVRRFPLSRWQSQALSPQTGSGVCSFNHGDSVMVLWCCRAL